VIIRADASSKTGIVQELIQKCQENGFEKFALRVKQAAAP
jgi:biopolymer transport protein ExbD